MRRRQRWLVVLLAAVALGTVAAALIGSWERLLGEWYLHQLASADPRAQQEARARLVWLRSIKAVPRFLGPEGGEEGSKDAARILERLSPASMGDLAVLLRSGDDGLHARVVELHREAGADRTALATFLRQVLRHPNPWLRRFAAEELAGLGRDGSLAVPDLEAASQDDSEEVRFWADVAIESIRHRGG